MVSAWVTSSVFDAVHLIIVCVLFGIVYITRIGSFFVENIRLFDQCWNVIVIYRKAGWDTEYTSPF